MSSSVYMDVHVPSAITEGLRRRGIDVLTAQEDEMREADDVSLLMRSTQLDRVLFSQDEDLLAVAADWQSKGTNFAGVVYAHQLGPGIGRIVDDLALLMLAAEPQELENQVIYLPL